MMSSTGTRKVRFQVDANGLVIVLKNIITQLTQLYKGAIYELDLILHPTVCMKDAVLQDPDYEATCEPQGNSVNVSCEFLIWQRIWDNHNVVINTSECLRAGEFESSASVREIHTQPDKLIKATKTYQEVIRDIGEQLKEKSRLPPDAPYTEYFYVVENASKKKIAILEYKWNLTGCLEGEDINSSECYDKLPKNTLLTCSAEFDWPYRRNESWVELLGCSLTPTVSREDELYSITPLAMAKDFNTSLPVEYPTFMGRTLRWHFRRTEESITLSPEDENWIFPLIREAYRREHEKDDYVLEVSPKEFINMRKLITPDEILRFMVKLLVKSENSYSRARKPNRHFKEQYNIWNTVDRTTYGLQVRHLYYFHSVVVLQSGAMVLPSKYGLSYDRTFEPKALIENTPIWVWAFQQYSSPRTIVFHTTNQDLCGSKALLVNNDVMLSVMMGHASVCNRPQFRE
ncbi:hypothetical protein CLF_106683 [Clonorchis sinensis]|uniref:Uncharacterized protein n=1 Tax=Clonorchis sinensis TaxID=79923 RepID=G7YFI2_CLOSI|nr:hypothetical protein CLF_106683 [Clonorchis sinensis]